MPPELASFAPTDPDCLVLASLACPRCLSGDADWQLRPDPDDARADCRCRACGHARALALTPDQALRLSLHAAAPLDPTPRAPAALPAR